MTLYNIKKRIEDYADKAEIINTVGGFPALCVTASGSAAALALSDVVKRFKGFTLELLNIYTNSYIVMAAADSAELRALNDKKSILINYFFELLRAGYSQDEAREEQRKKAEALNALNAYNLIYC